MGRDALIRYRAERLLRRDFSGLRVRVVAIVRSRLRSRGVTLDPHDLDACYAQAWQGLYSRLLAGEQIEDLAAWLVVATHRRALDELRARARQSRACEAGAQLASASGAHLSGAADFAGELDDRARLRHVLEALNGALSPRERQAAALCYLQGLSRSHAARHMGVSKARMRKLMDGSPGKPGVAAKVGALLETIDAGRWCEQQGSLMRAYAFGVLRPEGERHALAQAHLRECPACRAFVLSLRGLAAALPPLPLPLLSSVGARRAAGRGRRVTGGSRASRWGATRLATSHGVSAPAAKAALIVATALSAGGAMVVLAQGAPGRASRPASHSRSIPTTGREPLLAHRAQPPRPQRRSTHRRGAASRRAAAGAKRSLPRASMPAPTAIVPSSSENASEASAPGEEFSPERAASRRS
ncbi:MAG: RNA polymerase sigma factor [Solirubrobacteraceae bacterium]